MGPTVTPHRNVTKNQHYVSRAEQRLNASNPAAQPENQRVYVFEVEDRLASRLKAPKSVKIENNFAWQDLFSFDIPGGAAERGNFESLFNRYEQGVAKHSQALLEKLQRQDASIKAEILHLFCMKFLNFMRNPHVAPRMRDILRLIASYAPTDPELAGVYAQVRSGNRPHAHAVCRRFQIDHEDYQVWLRALFMLLQPLPGLGSNFFEQAVKDFFESSYVQVQVYHYPSPGPGVACLLSDRAYNGIDVDGAFGEFHKLGWMMPGTSMGFEFNLTAKAFARFIFMHGEGLHPKVAPVLRKSVQVSYEQDELEALVAYNRRTVAQCAEYVCCASEAPPLAL